MSGASLRLPAKVAYHGTRFVPSSRAELLMAVFATWNVLDGNMKVYAPAYRYATGYLREHQLYTLIRLVEAQHVQHYCEIGFNGGHSLAAVLLANPNITATVFDTMQFNYSVPAHRLMQETFGKKRFTLHGGDSHKLLPKYIHEIKGKCDVILLDGDHTNGVRHDYRWLAHAATPGANMMIVDDIQTAPGKVMQHYAQRGLLRVVESFGPYPKGHELNPCMRTLYGPLCFPWGYAVASFTRNDAMQPDKQQARL